MKNDLIQPFKDLKELNNHLKLSILALFVYFFSRILMEISYAISEIIDGYFDLSDFLEVINYKNFLNVIAIFILYLSIRNKSRIPINEREQLIISSLLTIFAISYLMSFYFIEQIISLTPIGINSLPNSPSYFLPFDWYNIRDGYDNITSDYVMNYSVYRFIAAVISAISILFAAYSIIKFLKSKENIVKPRLIPKSLLSELSSLKRKSFFILLFIPFTFYSIENIKARDYASLWISASFLQEDLVEFQSELNAANVQIFSAEKFEARKIAATKAFKEMNTDYQNLDNDAYSIWSGNLKELKIATLDWIQLWEENLKQLSINGYTEDGLIFDLTQQYYKLNKLGEFRAPMLADDYQVEFWRDELVPLVK